ncbi:MAG: hypothetical protein V4631_06290 [Pseudomonadota bacterium]
MNAVGGIRRNAWRCTWILFPDSKDWKLADALRTGLRPPRVRKPAGALDQPRATQSKATQAIDSAIVSDGPNLQQPIDDKSPPGGLIGEAGGRHLQAGIAFSPARHGGATDRRTTGDDRIWGLLRQEMFPLLYRMCAFDRMPA